MSLKKGSCGSFLVSVIFTALPLCICSSDDEHLHWPADIRANFAVDEAASKSTWVLATVQWRRKDLLPGPMNSTVEMVCGPSEVAVQDVIRVSADRITGVYAFKPVCGHGSYSMYYVTHVAGNSPGSVPPGSLPQAKFLGFENRDKFSGFTEMEFVASDAEVESLFQNYSQPPFLVFPEDRNHTIRMTNFAPARWIEHGPAEYLHLVGLQDEYVSFQLGLLARLGVQDVQVTLRSLHAVGANHTLPALVLSCLNLGGTSYLGLPFTKVLNVSAGGVQPLWLGLAVPRDASAIDYETVITVSGIPQGTDGRIGNRWSTHVTLRLSVVNAVIADHGDGDLWRNSRVRWLDSMLAQDDEPAKPFTPMRVIEREAEIDRPPVVELLGRNFTINSTSGLPSAVNSWGVELLSSGIALDVLEANASDAVSWVASAEGIKWLKQAAGIVSWTASATSSDGAMSLQTKAAAEADGFIDIEVAISAIRDVEIDSTRLTVPFNASLSTGAYTMGLNLPGRDRTNTPIEWRWLENLPKASHMLWVGGNVAGMRVKLKGTEDHWDNPMWNGVEVPSDVPRAWGGDDRDGGCILAAAPISGSSTVPLVCKSSKIFLRRGETLNFKFDLVITPFYKADTREHFVQRYFQLGYPLGAADFYNWGNLTQVYKANVINMHQGTVLNPYISWIFDPDSLPQMTKFVEYAHSLSPPVRVKSYFTVREQSLRSSLSGPFWAAVSLGDEIILPFYPKELHGDTPDPWEANPNQTNPWLEEHILTTTNLSQKGYSPAYSAVIPKSLTDANSSGRSDSSIHVSGVSRWNNWYVEAVSYAARRPPYLDGVYIDGAGFDRVTMKRLRKVLDAACINRTGIWPGRGLIDLHHMNTCGGDHCDQTAYAHYGNVSVALRFMTHLPYLTSLWFGEGFDYGADTTPARWLIEISGALFGLFGEMLGGDWSIEPWKAMVFGMTGRNPQAAESGATGKFDGYANPVYVWKFWDDFGIGNLQMCGWWQDGCPAAASDPDVKLTSFSSSPSASTPYSILAIANFAKTLKHNTTIEVDPVALGIDASKAMLFTPFVQYYQPARRFPIKVEEGKLVASISLGATSQTPIPKPGDPPPDTPIGLLMVLCGGSEKPCDQFDTIPAADAVEQFI